MRNKKILMKEALKELSSRKEASWRRGFIDAMLGGSGAGYEASGWFKESYRVGYAEGKKHPDEAKPSRAKRKRGGADVPF